MPKSLSILITGATTGIGRHAALHLASRGHHVIASGRKADLLADLAAEATRAGHRLATVPPDVSDALRMELAPFGVKVALIEPGPIRSEFGDRALAAARTVLPPGSPYAPVIARAEEIKAITDKQSAGPEVVSRAMEKALTSSRP